MDRSTFSRILVPLDGSRLAESAMPVAERLAIAFQGTIVLLHVVERAARSTVHGEPHLTDHAAADAYLRRLAADLQSRGLTVRTHAHDVREDNIAASIAHHGAEEHADLIVLCTHGTGGVRGLLSGSIAQQVLQQGTTPVLLVRPAASGTVTAFAPRMILAPLDATAAGEAALGPAATLAAKLGARLHLVMVVATRGTVRGDRAAAATLLPSATRLLLDIEEEQAAAYLQRLAEQLGARGIMVETEVRRGDTVAELAGDAAEHDIGLVVAATHGRAGLQAIWTGSVAARLLKRTGAPVLLLRTIEK